MADGPQQLIELRRLTPGDAEVVERFLRDLPEGDRTFLQEEADAETVARWCADARSGRWIAAGPDGTPQAMLSVVPGAGWSSHVGELHLVVDQRFRRQGLGRRLARFGLAEAVRLGLRKIVVQVVAEKEADIAMFTSIGFMPEALLADHICDRDGNLQDLVVLAHEAGDVSASMDLIGLGGEVGSGGAA